MSNLSYRVAMKAYGLRDAWHSSHGINATFEDEYGNQFDGTYTTDMLIRHQDRRLVRLLRRLANLELREP